MGTSTSWSPRPAPPPVFEHDGASLTEMPYLVDNKGLNHMSGLNRPGTVAELSAEQIVSMVMDPGMRQRWKDFAISFVKLLRAFGYQIVEKELADKWIEQNNSLK